MTLVGDDERKKEAHGVVLFCLETRHFYPSPSTPPPFHPSSTPPLNINNFLLPLPTTSLINPPSLKDTSIPPSYTPPPLLPSSTPPALPVATPVPYVANSAPPVATSLPQW